MMHNPEPKEIYTILTKHFIMDKFEKDMDSKEMKK